MSSILSISEFFKIRLNAPLINTRWSWGALSQDKEKVYLSIWADEITVADGKTWVIILNNDLITSPAKQERIDHIDLIKNGLSAYALIKIAKDVTATPRDMKEFNSEYLRIIKNNFFTDKDGRLIAELGDRLPV
jgi:hypothetical protein